MHGYLAPPELLMATDREGLNGRREETEEMSTNVGIKVLTYTSKPHLTFFSGKDEAHPSQFEFNYGALS